jgi:citrate lyase subunit beta / citryl-CoA lyase
MSGMPATSIRPLRSVLYVPASNARALDKARTLRCDAVLVDLEDAVAPAAKDTARGQAVSAIRAGGWEFRDVALRVNGADTPWGPLDLAAAAESGARAVVLPKVERPETVRDAAAALAEGQELWAMLETPRGILAAAEIASASPRLAALVAGTSDLVKDLRARHTPGRAEVLASLGLLLLAARANGLVALDGVHLDLDDAAGFEAACRQGRDLGFDGKTLVHPRTIDVANRIFAPTDDDVAIARRVISAHAEATMRGEGVVVVDGRLVESLHVEMARRTVALASAIAARGG